MEFELLNELVESGYEAEDLDELYEFCIEYILEYEDIVSEKVDVSREVIKKILKKKNRKGLHPRTSEYMRRHGIALAR